MIEGKSTDNVALIFYPYFSALDQFARIELSSLQNIINKLSSEVLINYSSSYNSNTLDDVEANSIYYLSKNKIAANWPLSVGAGYAITISLGTNNKIQILLDAYGRSGVIRGCVNGVWNEFIQLPFNLSNNNPSSTISLFSSIGCCGDSFTAGYLYNKPTSDWYDPNYVENGEYPNISYPSVMGRLYGVNTTIYAKGGLTSGAWRTDSKGLPMLLADTPKDLYIIALGLNDKTQNVPIGQETDIDNEPVTQTYLGNMGAIIRDIKVHAPNCKIILCKSLWVYNAGTTVANSYYNYISTPIEILSNHLSIPYIETLDDIFFSSNEYINGLKGLHPTAPLYAGIGKRIGELVSECIFNNPDYFYNFYA